MELDVVAESIDGKTLLVGEAKLSAADTEIEQLKSQLQKKVEQLPFAKRYQRIETAVFSASIDHTSKVPNVFTLYDLLRVLV